MKRVSLLLPALFVLAMAPRAHADSGRLHLHADFGVGGAIAGAGSYQRAGDERSVGGALALGLDWQFHPPFALEATFQFGGFTKAFPNTSTTGSSFIAFSAGARFRLLEDHRGYLGERGGRAAGNLWLAPHIGFYKFDSLQYGFDFSAGYEFSVHRPISIGPFVRLMTLIGGATDGADVILLAGVASTFEVMDPPSSDDSDGDGVHDDEERRLGTNLRSADTDGDGLTDRVEIDTETDPLATDTDVDGLADGFEDPNGNGLLDLEETDPRDFDTDDGGISDGDEVFTYHTNPRNRRDDDADADGVANYADDCPETPAGTTVNSSGCPAQQAVIDYVAIAFVPNRTRLSPEGETAMTTLAASLTAGRADIVVYVSSTGDAAADAQRAQRRADALSTWLTQHSVTRERYTITAAGPDPEADRTRDANVAELQVTRN